MATRVVEGKKPYTGGKAISIDENKVISLNLRDENNLIIYDAGDDEIYVDLQLDDEITPTSAFPIGVNVGRVIVDNGWDKPGTIISAETTSGDNIKIFYADEGTLWIDNGTGTFKQIYFKADVDALLLALRNYIDGELAKKQNGVSSDTAPENPSEGDLWYDTTNSAMKVWDGTAWQSVGTGGGGSDIEYVTQAEYNALLPGALTDNKHYFIYSTSGGGGWQPGVNTIAYFPLDTDLLDHSGNSFSVTVNGNVSIGTAGGVSAGDFTSLGDIVGSYTYNNTSLTALGYIYKTANPNYDNASIFGYGINNLGGPEPGLMYYNTNGASWASNKPGVVVQDSDTNMSGKATCVSMNNNQWYHFGFTYDVSTGLITLYVNGGYNQSYTATISRSPNLLGMSRRADMDRSWIGYMSNVIFEDKCWSAQEIQGYYDQTKSLYGIS